MQEPPGGGAPSSVTVTKGDAQIAACTRAVVAAILFPAAKTGAVTLPVQLLFRQLLRRVFGEQVTQCPRCGDHLRVLAFITDPRITAHILDHLGLTSDLVPIAPIAPARAPPENLCSEFDFGC